ncbi:hypothetical protein DYB25_002933 [Aphanomyces astaci]|uniref:IPT/TIG domain-containing protein n=1 Tax=Aphanomyces astaci TaxID=112090 RepID=A0A397AJP8_APHAT|nr:hypothetical protein DYB25_002933 [Aphanomyces astaci]RHY65449.1 hypothetical protein DYB30_004705 [Aphanomyces astaci]RHZ12471.1 hypothetical protein DYB26_004061 [Aphanomyces astaci]RHZ39714.1 hypothetical protein DYB31_004180 [Aphanomyces astaci]
MKVIAWALTSVAYASVSLDGCPWPPDPPASDPLCLRYSNGTSIAVNGTRFSPRRDVLWNLTHQHISAVNEFPRSDNNDTLYMDLRDNPALMVTITDCDTLARVQSSRFTLRLDSMVDANKASVGCTNGTLQSVADAFVCLVATCHPAMASRAPFPVVTPKASPGVVKGMHSTIRAKVAQL